MSKFCPKCGNEQLDGAKFCRNCGANLPEVETIHGYSQAFNDKNYTVFIIAGYVIALLRPLFGFVISIYLMTRNDSAKANKHGKFIIIIAILVGIISFFMTF